MAFAKSAVLFEILCLSSYSKLKYSFLSHLLIYGILNQMYRNGDIYQNNNTEHLKSHFMYSRLSSYCGIKCARK